MIENDRREKFAAKEPENEIDLTHSSDWRMPGIFGGVLRCSVQHKRFNRFIVTAARGYHTCISGWQHGSGRFGNGAWHDE